MTPPPRDDLHADDRPQAAYLARWLQERRMQEALHERDAGTAAAAFPDGGPPPCDPTEAASLRAVHDVTAGQIRLLHPRHLPLAHGPLYVAVLSRKGTQSFTTAPFSRFSVPAMESEWATPRTTACLRVLSIGFARPLSTARLAAGWRVDTLRDDELRDAVAVFHYLYRHTPLPTRLLRRIGAPVIHPDDPRHAYGEELAALMDALWIGDRRTQHSGSGRADAYPMPARTTLPLAAEPPPAYGRARRFRIEDTPFILTAYRAPDNQEDAFRIADPADTPAAEADGYVLRAPDGRGSPPAHGGCLRWNAHAPLATCRVECPDGSTHALRAL